jgi:thioesterase domain-containing protein
MADNIGDGSDIPEANRRLLAVHGQAIRDYYPQPYPGRVTLLRVRALSLFKSYDPQMGWGRVAKGGVEVQMIAGAHYNILESPYVRVLAARFKESLERAQRQASPAKSAARNQAAS